MASEVQICNMALSHIGSEARVSSISPPDGSVEAGHCATFFDAARTEMLEPGNWNFSLTRASLAPVEIVGSQWLFGYALPSDCMRALRILRPGEVVTVFTQDDVQYSPDDNSTASFEIEGGVLYTNEPEAVLVYVRDITDPSKFTPSFVSALSYLLASYLAGPIIKGNEGTRIGDAMRERATRLGSASATAAANASSTGTDFMPSSLRVRR